jgi:hypothetical protein
MVAGLAIAFLVALISRDPTVLTLPQFWAEDGFIFYQQAHELGFFHALVTPYAGYLHLYPRLVGGFALLLPLRWAPLIFNLAALLAELSAPLYLCSSRMEKAAPLRVRVLLSVLYIGVPNVAKVHGNLTNAQWHLAVLSLLVLLATQTRSQAGMVVDFLALTVGAFTGPFALLLLPAAVLIMCERRDRKTALSLGVLSAGAIVQTFTLLLSKRSANPELLGASVSGFCKILAFQVFVPAFRGINNSQRLSEHPAVLLVVSCAVTVVGLAALVYVYLRGGLEIRCLLLFAALTLGASLAFPLAAVSGFQWQALQRPGSTHRYWYIPELTVAAATVWLAVASRKKFVRAAAALGICAMLVADASQWRLAALPDLHFASYVEQFYRLPRGAQMKIPINPPPGWFLTLTRK